MDPQTPEDERLQRSRQERDDLVARTLVEVRAQVEVLKRVTSDLADALDGIMGDDSDYGPSPYS